MHVGRSVLISLALCIVFFVLLRPESPAPPRPTPSAQPDTSRLSPTDSAADSLADGRS